MATPEEHYAVALGMANQVGAAMQSNPEVPVHDIMALAALHVDLARLQLEIQRPGRSLILPGHN